MIKKTLYFGNPVYLSLKNAQLVIKLPEVVKSSALPEGFKQMSEVTKPIEDIGVVVLDNKQITITSGVLEALLENNCAVITCDSKSMPVGLMLPLYGNTTQNERFRHLSTLVKAPYTIFCATPFLPSNIMLLISLVTTLLLYNGSANTSLF